jgi:hypothetical protein
MEVIAMLIREHGCPREIAVFVNMRHGMEISIYFSGRIFTGRDKDTCTEAAEKMDIC